LLFRTSVFRTSVLNKQTGKPAEADFPVCCEAAYFFFAAFFFPAFFLAFFLAAMVQSPVKE
jgi:hypothetical protein